VAKIRMAKMVDPDRAMVVSIGKRFLPPPRKPE
jgi:hypothetical protein